MNSKEEVRLENQSAKIKFFHHLFQNDEVLFIAKSDPIILKVMKEKSMYIRKLLIEEIFALLCDEDVQNFI